MRFWPPSQVTAPSAPSLTNLNWSVWLAGTEAQTNHSALSAETSGPTASSQAARQPPSSYPPPTRKSCSPGCSGGTFLTLKVSGTSAPESSANGTGLDDRPAPSTTRNWCAPLPVAGTVTFTSPSAHETICAGVSSNNTAPAACPKPSPVSVT